MDRCWVCSKDILLRIFMSIRKMCAEGEDAGEFFGRYTEDQYCDQCLQIVVTMMTRPKDKREILIMLSGYSVFVADQHHPVCLYIP